MQKNISVKAAAVILSAACACGASTAALAGDKKGAEDEQFIAPAHAGISTTYTSLTVNPNGSLKCAGNTSVIPYCNAGISAELQMYDGGWTTIKKWSDHDEDFAAVSSSWFVANRHSYRLKTTHYSYGSKWDQMGSIVKYSGMVFR